MSDITPERKRLADAVVGDALGERTFPVTRADLVRYAGASGDFNTIHWDETFAKEVGLPDVIAHGMLTMATAVEIVSQWCGDPGAITQYSVRFTRPVVVPREGTSIQVSGAVIEVADGGGPVTVELTARCGEDTVLGKARAVVRR